MASKQYDLKPLSGFVEDGGDAGEACGVGVGEDVVQHDELALFVESHIGRGRADGEVDLMSLAAGDLAASGSSSPPPYPIPE